MARQNGILPLEGTLGNITFFRSKEGFMARSKGGVDADKIRTHPSFQRTRENNAEFGAAGKAGKQLRVAFRVMMLTCPDSRVVSRLTAQLLKAIQLDETSARGERNILDGKVESLEGFEFNIHAKLSTSFFAPYTASINRSTGVLKTEIPSFVPANMVLFPAGATHFKITTSGVAIDFAMETYEADLKETAYLPINNLATALITLENNITAASTVPLFLAMSIEFTQMINGNYYTLKNGAFNAMSFVKVEGV